MASERTSSPSQPSSWKISRGFCQKFSGFVRNSPVLPEILGFCQKFSGFARNSRVLTEILWFCQKFYLFKDGGSSNTSWYHQKPVFFRDNLVILDLDSYLIDLYYVTVLLFVFAISPVLSVTEDTHDKRLIAKGRGVEPGGIIRRQLSRGLSLMYTCREYVCSTCTWGGRHEPVSFGLLPIFQIAYYFSNFKLMLATTSWEH